jgi:hypothetical protein
MATAKSKTPDLKKLTLAQCADRLYLVREERLGQDRSSKVLKEEENTLKERIIEELPKSDASGIAGKVARVAVKTDTIQQVNDWTAFYDWVLDEAIKHRRKKTGLEHSVFDMFYRAINQSAVEERIERGEKVAGIGPFKVVKVSITKV